MQVKIKIKFFAFLLVFLCAFRSFAELSCTGFYRLDVKVGSKSKDNSPILYSKTRGKGVDVKKWTQLMLDNLSEDGFKRLDSLLYYSWHSGNSILRKLSNKPLTIRKLFEALNRVPSDVDDKHRIDLAVGFKNKHTSEWKWLRPNRDEAPDLYDWEIAGYGPFENALFLQLMAEGKMPLSLNIMAAHDIAGHYLPWLTNFALMKATRVYYKKLQKRKIDQPPFGFEDVVFEFLSLPDISKVNEINQLFGTSQKRKLVTPKSVLDSYNSFEQQRNKIEQLSKIGETLILRLGGAIGQDEYIFLHAERPNTGNLKAEGEIFANSDIFFPKEHSNLPAIGRAPRHSLHYVWHQFNELYSKLKLMESYVNGEGRYHPSEISKVQQILLGRLAAIEAIFKNALTLKITPERFITESSNSLSSNNTKIFVNSFAPVRSIWRNLIGN